MFHFYILWVHEQTSVLFLWWFFNIRKILYLKLRGNIRIRNAETGSNRSSRPEMFNKKRVFKNFAKFTGKHCVGVSFLINLQARPARPWHQKTLIRPSNSSKGFHNMRVIRGGRGSSPLPFFKNWKKGALDLGKIAVIYGLKFSLKVQFLRVLRRKAGRSFSFSCCRWLFIKVS